MLQNERNTAPKDASGRGAALGAPGVWLEKTGLRGPARASPGRGEGHRLERRCARPWGPRESQSWGAPPPHPPALQQNARRGVSGERLVRKPPRTHRGGDGHRRRGDDGGREGAGEGSGRPHANPPGARALTLSPPPAQASPVSRRPAPGGGGAGARGRAGGGALGPDRAPALSPRPPPARTILLPTPPRPALSPPPARTVPLSAPLLSPTDVRVHDLRVRDILRVWQRPGPLGIVPPAGAARGWARGRRPEGHGGRAGPGAGGFLRGAASSAQLQRPVRRRRGCGLRARAGGGGARPPGKPLERRAGRGSLRCGEGTREAGSVF